MSSISRVTLLIRVRPIALGLLEDLVQSGHLERKVIEAMPVLDVLPARCPSDEALQLLPELVRRPVSCDEPDSDRDFTLVWSREEAEGESVRARRTVINGVPALCLAHPTYIAQPAVAQ